jgi:hypothetical protein
VVAPVVVDLNGEGVEQPAEAVRGQLGHGDLHGGQVFEEFDGSG